MGKFKLTPEIIEKAKAAKSALELITIAKTEGIEISIEEGKVAFAQLSLKTGELRDDEIDNVAGGGGCMPLDPSDFGGNPPDGAGNPSDGVSDLTGNCLCFENLMNKAAKG